MIYRLVKRNLFSGFRLASNQHWLSYGLTPTRSTRRGLNQSWSRNLTPWINQLNVSNIKKLARLTLEAYCPLNPHDQNSVKAGWKYKYILSRKCILNVAFKMPTILFKPRYVDIVPGHQQVICCPMMRSFDVFFYLRLNKRLNKQTTCRWFETPSLPLWHHWDDLGREKLTPHLRIF